MLESEIKKLTVAVEALTAALNNQEVETVNEAVDEAPEKEEVEEEETSDEDQEETSEDSDEVTVESVQALAKEKIKDGTPRKDIKTMITKLGGESMSELDEKALVKLHAQLEKL